MSAPEHEPSPPQWGASPARTLDDYHRDPPPAPQQTNGFAIASLVLGILWVYWIGAVLALVFGYKARQEIELSAGRQGGGGLATAGVASQERWKRTRSAGSWW